MGIREIAEKVCLTGKPDPTFLEYDPGFFDQAENRVEPVGVNPFAPKVLPMSSE